MWDVCPQLTLDFLELAAEHVPVPADRELLQGYHGKVQKDLSNITISL
jgi:hypothetical protein